MITVELLQANEGDCIFLNLDNIHILIDAGKNARCHTQIISQELEKQGWNGILDLVILTHIDNDHIGGAQAFIEDERLQIREIWYNGYQHLPQDIFHFGRGQKVSYGEKRSVIGANNLSALIKQKKILWNWRFNECAVIRNIEKPIQIEKNLKIWILNPGIEELNSLKKVWNKTEYEINRCDSEMIDGELDELTMLSIPITSTKTNDSSIVIIIEYNDKKMLFTGDASQRVWMLPLEKWCSIYNPSKHFELIKVPHHGSEKSTNADFYKKFTAEYFMISTDGIRGREQHPSKVVLAHIIKNNPNCNICFNYAHNGYQYCRKLLQDGKKYYFHVMVNQKVII